MTEPIKAISLLSGGLDSILATRVVMDQGVDVTAVHFYSPFFGGRKRGHEEEAIAYYREAFGIRAMLVDVSDPYMSIVAHPRFGYGKNFNPCIDCKIFLITRAREMMAELGARFLITGEVVGQRPMSQRRDTMDKIAKDVGVTDVLLRPLSARILPPTLPEREGWVDREKLHAFNGRSRKPQIALARHYGIADYPTPAGGCSLTDPILSARMRRYFDAVPEGERTPADVRFLMSGRPFRLPGGSLLTVGRSDAENRFLFSLFEPGDVYLKVLDIPGPLGLFRPKGEGDERLLAASVVRRYCTKAGPEAAVGFGLDPEALTDEISFVVDPATDAILESWRV